MQNITSDIVTKMGNEFYMKQLKKSYLAALLFSALSTNIVFAAQELPPEKANSLQSFKEISIRGLYYSELDKVRAISKAADKQGAAYFYITSTNVAPSNDGLRIVYAKLYKSDAESIDKMEHNFRNFSGVLEYPKDTAIHFEPFDIVRLRGYFPTQYDINTAVAKAAVKKQAYAFFIDRSIEDNGGNQNITAYLFKKDAPERKIQPENAIPYDSEAGQLALAQGGEAAMQVERPGYYSSTVFNEQFYAKKFNNTVENVTTTKAKNQNTSVETDTKIATINSATTNTAKTDENSTQPSILPQQRSSRYTVTLPDGSKIEELNDATAAKMVPFDTIKFKGYYVSEQEISFNAGKKALAKGAKYYHISRIAQDSRGPNKTIYVDLYR